jgi:cytochrome b6-f complex iron-sulfur subunit
VAEEVSNPEGSKDAGAAEQEGSTRAAGRIKRRRLLAGLFASSMGLGFWALGLAGGLWAALLGRFMMNNAPIEPPNKFKIGLPGDYPAGYVETRFKETHGIWVVNGEYQGARQIYALSVICTHLGCMTLWQQSEQKFKCPCHGSGFYKDGINFEGPAPRPLERYALRIADDGQLEVDKSKVFHEELGEWDDPACCVLV